MRTNLLFTASPRRPSITLDVGISLFLYTSFGILSCRNRWRASPRRDTIQNHFKAKSNDMGYHNVLNRMWGVLTDESGGWKWWKHNRVLIEGGGGGGEKRKWAKGAACKINSLFAHFLPLIPGIIIHWLREEKKLFVCRKLSKHTAHIRVAQ